jgi:hypothetical protein
MNIIIANVFFRNEPTHDTIRNVTPLESEPRGYSLSTHGAVKRKVGNYILLGPNREKLTKTS